MWRTISSLLKAQAIKSIPAPFHMPDQHTNSRIKLCRSIQLKSRALLLIKAFLFFLLLLCLSKQLFAFRKRRDKNKHLYSMIGPSRAYCVHRVWPVVIPHHSPNSLPARTKSSTWLQAWTVPLVSCCSPSVLKAKPRYGHYTEGPLKKMSPGGAGEVNTAATLQKRKRHKEGKRTWVWRELTTLSLAHSVMQPGFPAATKPPASVYSDIRILSSETAVAGQFIRCSQPVSVGLTFYCFQVIFGFCFFSNEKPVKGSYAWQAFFSFPLHWSTYFNQPLCVARDRSFSVYIERINQPSVMCGQFDFRPLTTPIRLFIQEDLHPHVLCQKPGPRYRWSMDDIIHVPWCRTPGITGQWFE